MASRSLALVKALLVAGLLFPVCWMLIASLTPEAALFGSPSILPRALSFEHYRALFDERDFMIPIRNSVLVAAMTTALALPIAAACAYALARLQMRGRGFILALILAVWLLTAFFRQLPRDLEEAALVDGASRVRALRDIVLPIAAPGIASTAILTFLYCWNEFLFALSFTLGPERYTIPVAVMLFRSRYQVPWGQVLAATVVASLPVAILVLAFQRRIVAGLSAGASKG